MNILFHPLRCLLAACLFPATSLYGATISAVYSTATTVPVTAAGYSAGGNTLDISLNFAPPAGTDLTVIGNTSSSFIQGRFDNLEQGQVVRLVYSGITYSFAANYHGGTGNDLVLHWANTRLAGWGYNASSQLGNGASANLLIPAAVGATGILADKSFIAGSVGNQRSLALCSDGMMAAWGSGRLGDGTISASKVPVAVDLTGVLAAKTVIAVASGYDHSMALCSDGTLVSWGFNASGQLGIGTTTANTAPALVDRSGVLLGKDIVAIGAGSGFSAALCADGTLATWGSNAFGQLGNNSTTQSNVPVLVNTAGVLATKTPTALSVGGVHCLILCSDGTLAAWGANFSGQLGNGTTTQGNVPVAVTTSGTLSGKTITSLSAGNRSSLALCSDGTLAVWGDNSFGQLGIGSTTNSTTPVSVNRTGVLLNKTITAITSGYNFCRVHCSDGSIATWGANDSGQLGNNTTVQSTTPVLVNNTILKAGERFVGGFTGSEAYHNIAVIASPPAPVATTLAVNSVTDSGATLNGSVNANGTNVTVSFEYGLTTSYGSSIAATPPSHSGNVTTAVTAIPGGLQPGTTYHYRLIATNTGGSAYGLDQAFTTTDYATLSGLTLSSGSLAPSFASRAPVYQAVVPFSVTSLTLTPTTAYPDATVRVNGGAVPSGSASAGIPLAVGGNNIGVVVSAADGINTKTYTLTVTRLPEVYRFDSASTVPVSIGDFEATGLPVEFGLNFAPVPGTTLTALRNTGNGPIRGTFSNLAQGQIVRLTHAGIAYDFAANYFGGSGNDLVLTWAHTRLLAWGANTGRQLGTGLPDPTNLLVPTPVDMSGVLAGKTVIATANGLYDSVALCADGTLATWGAVSTLPVLVNTSGVLNGKTPVAVAAGTTHFLVLCSDGTLAAWGNNDFGQFGNNTVTSSTLPVAVDRSGVLAGKFPVAIAAGEWFNLVLCSDGSLASWGSNNHGRLGDDSTTQRRVPVLVNTTTALAGKSVVAIACGSQHSLALCSDGTMATWGNNTAGQLGNNSTVSSNLPVSVNTAGILSGKSAVAIDAGQNHNLVLCSDGTLASWGENNGGQLGNNSTTNSSVPVTVVRTGALNLKTITSIASGLRHNLVLCSDGTLASWGYNFYGVLGNNTTTQSIVPVLVNTGMLRTGERFSAAFTDGEAFHNFAVAAGPPPPTVTTLAASAIQPDRATLGGRVNAAGASSAISFEYGLTTAYGTTVAASPSTASGTSTTAVSKVLGGLIAGRTYHFRVVATNANGTSRGANMTFTASNPPVFAGYSISTAYQKPAVISLQKLLAKASDPDGALLSVTSAGPASANGGSAAFETSSIRYTPPNGFSGTDSFNVTITDSGGASVTGAVTIAVGPASTAGGQTANPPKLTMLAGGRMNLKFHGIPGRSYLVQRSTNLSNWTTIATITANSLGGINHIDETPTQPNAFYRLAVP